MSRASYRRGSQAIGNSIVRDYVEKGGEARYLRKQMVRAEKKVRLLETYCTNAQSLFIDVTDPRTSTGLLKGWMHQVWLKKRYSKKFQKMLSRCNDAHCTWVDSDHTQVFKHLSICREKAQAWEAVIKALNSKDAFLPFNRPGCIVI